MLETMMIVLAGLGLAAVVGYVLYRRSAAVRAELDALYSDLAWLEQRVNMHIAAPVAVAHSEPKVATITVAPAPTPKA